jgi:hypothetical protein
LRPIQVAAQKLDLRAVGRLPLPIVGELDKEGRHALIRQPCGHESREWEVGTQDVQNDDSWILRAI